MLSRLVTQKTYKLCYVQFSETKNLQYSFTDLEDLEKIPYNNLQIAKRKGLVGQDDAHYPLPTIHGYQRHLYKINFID